ncbi:DNA polymerase subunit gamma-1, mitochondrial [Musca domestica]|uniref:Mitochondrial DNA polymerase catalytic subunit n=1 Tax=Musca domestica TaxID=7370 RepID=A0A9J7CNA1_MUSDO|nr:DNA polymerase subunit gamma-1, mitochondrial [Musca domestica]
MSSFRFYSKIAPKEIYPRSTIKIFRSNKKVEKQPITKANTKPPPQEAVANATISAKEDTKPTKTQTHETIPPKEEPKRTTKGNTVANNVFNKVPKPRNSEYYENLVKIQMLSSGLHKQIFPNSRRDDTSNISNTKESKIKEDLQRHGIDIESTETLEDVDLKLPPLKGKNIEEHFMEIGREQVKAYKELLMPLVNIKTLPRKPEKWSLQEGWTIYDPGTGTGRSIDYPQEDGLVFDVEVCLAEGPMPTLATAVSEKHWYSWVSPRLAAEQPEMKVSQKIPHHTTDELIPLGRRGPKIVIGHNVSYDRARLKEQYLLEDTKVRFLDTMSLHVCVSGVTSYQRALMKSKKEPAPEDLEWLSQSSLNSLTEVHRLYCGGKPIDKEERNIFVEGTLQDVRQEFQSLMTYCSNDVAATHRILQKLFPLFEERFPHPVTLAGMLEMGSAYLPVNKNWLRYINESDLAYEDLSIEAKYHLASRADEACSLMEGEKYKNNLWLWDEDWSTQELKMKKPPSKKCQTKVEVDNPFPPDQELSDEEKRLYKKFQYLYETKSLLPARRPLLPGYPAWYRKLCQKPPKHDDDSDWKPEPTEISTGMQIAPKLLSLCWEGFPLHYNREHGWGFLVPFTTKHSEDDEMQGSVRVPIEELAKQCPIPDFARNYASQEESEYAFDNLHKELDAKLGRRDFYSKAPKKNHTEGLYKGSGVWCNQILDNCCFFLKLPHKNGKSLRVGNPLSRDFLNKFSENVLTSADSSSNVAGRIIKIARMMSYWRNNRDRIIGQLVVWLTPNELPDGLRALDYEYGAICPQVVTCGTLTRRAMEPTWMTASNSQTERIGSELRAMVQAPPNYRIVGADVDSQELWIASVLGDAYAYGIHGATPLGWMTLSGTKAKGSDMHSITAKAVGISRDHAKVINYARIYGAGQNFAEGLLKQFNPTFSSTEARSKAMKMFAITKGKKSYRLRKEFQEDYENRSYSGYEALKLASSNNRGVEEMFEKARWEGGTESAMFNRLEEIASGDEPVTPFLSGRLSRALETNGTSDENRFLPTRINWVVQSGAVDFLHLMLVSMRWLLADKARFCLSFHDECRYLVEEKYAYQAALAMHITNLLTRAFCSSRLGLTDLPMSVAFFSSVEVDTVLRKECTMDCVTPSNPHGLKVGYDIQPGESLTVYEAIKKSGGNDLTKWQWISYK